MNVRMIKAVILAAGRGKRLNSLLNGKPKPLLNLFGKTLIEYPLEALRKNRIDECIVVTGYMAGALREYLGSGEKYGIKIDYVHNPNYEDGNGLSLYAAKGSLKNHDFFLVLMADHLIDPKIVKIALDNVKHAPLLCVDYSPCYPSQLKDATKVLVDEKGFIKDIGKNIDSWNAIDTGVFILDKRIFEAIRQIKDEKSLTLSRCIQQLVRNKVSIWACDVSGLFWLDIDLPEDLKFAEEILSR